MRFPLSFILLLSFVTVAFQTRDQSESPAVRIFFTGAFRSRAVTVKSGEEWFGLFPTQSGFELSRVTIKVEHVVAVAADTKVSVNKPGEPILLIKGLANLAEGPIKTVFWGNIFLEPGHGLGLKLTDNIRYGLIASGTTKTEETGKHIINYAIKLIYNTRTAINIRSQELVHRKGIDMDSPPKILWAGDLDRDEKLDLLMDLPDHYIVRQPTLFLSSMAKKDQLLMQVDSCRFGGL
jgi:hypothetical protein